MKDLTEEAFSYAEKTPDGYEVVGANTGGNLLGGSGTDMSKSFTNNNWEEEVMLKWNKYISDFAGNYKTAEFWIKETKDLLTKKDQEHKAELEIIKGEVQKLLETLPELESDEYDAGLLDMKQLVLAILDSHINKL